MHDHGQIYSGIDGASPGRFAALVTKHEVVTLGKLGEGTCPGSRPCARRRDVRLPDSGRSRLSGTATPEDRGSWKLPVAVGQTRHCCQMK